MKLLSLILFIASPIFPICLLLDGGNFSNPFLFVIGVLFIALHILPFLYLYLRVPSSNTHRGLWVYWFLVTLGVAVFGNFVYIDWMLIKLQPDYKPDAQEGVIFFVIPVYQLIIAFAACYVRNLASQKFNWFDEKGVNCNVFSMIKRV